MCQPHIYEVKQGKAAVILDNSGKTFRNYGYEAFQDYMLCQYYIDITKRIEASFLISLLLYSVNKYHLETVLSPATCFLY